MQSTAPSLEGTTLYISELTNGLVFTLSIRDIGHGEHEKHIWKTSYPLLDLLYPHWLPKQPVNTPVDFLSQALLKAEQAFGWNLRNAQGRFKIPEESFGEGLNYVSAYQELASKELLNKISQDKTAVSVVRRDELSIGKELLKHVDSFTHPVVVIVANFFSTEVIECIPKVVGKTKRWEYKSSKLSMATPQEFVDYIVQKKFLPFVGEHMPEGQIFNTLLNYTYWRPLSTSSQVVRDLWRALLTSTLAEVSQYTEVQKQPKGHIFVTGELPLFLQDKARMQLALIDGLGLSGMWTVTIDEHSQLLPFLADPRGVDVFRELSTEKSALWIILQSKKSKNIVKVKIGDVEYQGVYGNLYTYSNHTRSHEISAQIETDTMELSLPDIVSVGTVTIDLRTLPIIYGPNSIANSVKIPRWLDRIKKTINE